MTEEKKKPGRLKHINGGIITNPSTIVASGGWSTSAKTAYTSPYATGGIVHGTFPKITTTRGGILGYFGATESEPDYGMAAYWINMCAANPHWRIGVFHREKKHIPLLSSNNVEGLTNNTFPHNPTSGVVSIRDNDNPYVDEHYQITFANRSVAVIKNFDTSYSSPTEQSKAYDAVLYLGLNLDDYDYKHAIAIFEKGQRAFSIYPRLRHRL
jgi:hypothetical protein